MINNRNQTLDLMRFMAASWVVFYHLNEPIPYVDDPYRRLMKLGYVGVPVFFVISGYCIALAAERSPDWRSFAVRRFFRIYPPYLFSLVVSLFAIALFRLFTGANSLTVIPKTFSSSLATLFLLTEPLTVVRPVNWVYWTLSLEVCYYIIVGLARAAAFRHRLFFISIISLISLILPLGYSGLHALLKYWPIFATGTACFYLQNRQQRILASAIMLLSFVTVYRDFFMAGQQPYLYAMLGSFIIILASSYRDIASNPLSTAGDQAYSIYLLHVPIAIYSLGFLKTTYVQSHMLLNILVDIICFTVTLLCARGCFRWIEEPSIAVGRKVASRMAKANEG